MCKNTSKTKIGIVGGGIAGSTVALSLAKLGLEVTLIEKGPSLVNGPPICHLHAGGNLYREISDEQCLTLLRESISLLRFYPFAADYRPTVIAVPNDDKGKPQDLLPRLDKLQAEYESLIKNDSYNNVLGDPKNYFKSFSREEIEVLKDRVIVDKPSTFTEWLIPFAHYVDLNQLKFPIILVQEYGLNLFRLSANVELALQKIGKNSILFNTKVTMAERVGEHWHVECQSQIGKEVHHFDYLINAAGFRSGELDDMLGFKRQRLVEFKAAYVTKWASCNDIWPEVVFMGERGTPKGMAQFTPYPNGFFQLHGMTKEITLFEDGLVESSLQSAQPHLGATFIDKIDKGWSNNEIKQRSQAAINYLGRFIPEFASHATVSSKPMFGAQQIPGEDADLRVAGVSFVGEYYARCEIVKASSVLNVTDEIIKQLCRLQYLNNSEINGKVLQEAVEIPEVEVDEYARKICEDRQYPPSLGSCSMARSVS